MITILRMINNPALDGQVEPQTGATYSHSGIQSVMYNIYTLPDGEIRIAVHKNGEVYLDFSSAWRPWTQEESAQLAFAFSAAHAIASMVKAALIG